MKPYTWYGHCRCGDRPEGFRLKSTLLTHTRSCKSFQRIRATCKESSRLVRGFKPSCQRANIAAMLGSWQKGSVCRYDHPVCCVKKLARRPPSRPPHAPPPQVGWNIKRGKNGLCMQSIVRGPSGLCLRSVTASKKKKGKKGKKKKKMEVFALYGHEQKTNNRWKRTL